MSAKGGGLPLGGGAYKFTLSYPSTLFPTCMLMLTSVLIIGSSVLAEASVRKPMRYAFDQDHWTLICLKLAHNDSTQVIEDMQSELQAEGWHLKTRAEIEAQCVQLGLPQESHD